MIGNEYYLVTGIYNQAQLLMWIQYYIMISAINSTFTCLFRVGARKAIIIHIPISNTRIDHICLCINSILSCILLPPLSAVVFGGYLYLQLG